MKHIPRIFIYCILILLLSNCQIQKNESDNRLIEFRDRKIDLKPYIDGFPYVRFEPFYDAGKLY